MTNILYYLIDRRTNTAVGLGKDEIKIGSGKEMDLKLTGDLAKDYGMVEHECTLFQVRDNGKTHLEIECSKQGYVQVNEERLPPEQRHELLTTDYFKVRGYRVEIEPGTNGCKNVRIVK